MSYTAVHQVKWYCSGGHSILLQSALEVRDERDTDMEKGTATPGVIDEVMKTVMKDDAVEIEEGSSTPQMPKKNWQIKTPGTYRQAMKTPESAEWQSGCEEQIQKLKDANTWRIVPPQNAKQMGTKSYMENGYLTQRLTTREPF